MPAFNAFLAVCRQWRTAAAPDRTVWLGLDYTAVRAGLDLAGLTITPDLWAEVQEIETGALRALNGVEE